MNMKLVSLLVIIKSFGCTIVNGMKVIEKKKNKNINYEHGQVHYGHVRS